MQSEWGEGEECEWGGEGVRVYGGVGRRGPAEPVAVGQGERCPVRRGRLRKRGVWGALGRAAMGQGERMPLV